MYEKLWWEMLTEEEIKELEKYFPDYKKYERPTIEMKWILQSFLEAKYLNKK